MEKSHIFHKCEEEYYCNSGDVWVMQSLLNPDLILEFEGTYPVGSHDWKLKVDNAMCNQPNGYKVELTFTQCYPDKFTCASGHCISLEDRCNIDYNCKDHTDEKDCQKNQIQMKDDYVKELLPVSEFHEPCIVYINMSINSFQEISTKHVKFTTDFYLNLRWHDLRLNLWDLDHDFVKNRMTQKDLDKIWQPTLVFANALGQQNPIGSMIGSLIRHEDPMKEDISLATEGNYISFN